MRGQPFHRVSGIVLNVLSLTALITVLVGSTRPPQPDEGALAHVFQLSIAALAPTLLVFLAAADWERPSRIVRPLALPAAAVALAFVALYVLERRG